MELQMVENGNETESYLSDDVGFGYGFATFENPSWTLDQILLATGGRLLSGQVHAAFRSIVTDSRIIKPGDLFLALSGPNFDGIDFVPQAIKKGAVGVIVSRSLAQCPVPVILVGNSLQALGDLAAYRREMTRNIKLLAITGSSGKTTVKEMTAAILNGRGSVLKTRGNFNNLIGLPLSLLPANYRHDFAVLELGMSEEGEIARLTEITDPDIACINNVQEAHLAGLGSIEGVARAKGELFDGCRTSSIKIVNADDVHLQKWIKGSGEIITFGRNKGAMIRATHIFNRGVNGVTFTLHLDGMGRERVNLQVIGEHNVMNSLAAAALAYAAGAGMDDIIGGLESFAADERRLSIKKHPCGLRIINDSYNANPASMQVALATVGSLQGKTKIVAVLGDMLELGDFSHKAHEQIGKKAADVGFDYLFAFGQYADNVVGSALKFGMKRDTAQKFSSKDKIAGHIARLLQSGELANDDMLLVKGSRGMRMEEVIEALTNQPTNKQTN